MRGGTVGLAGFDRTIAVDSKNDHPQNGRVTVPPIPSDAKQFRMAFLPMFLSMFLFGFIFGHLFALVAIIIQFRADLHWVLFLNSLYYTIPFLLIYAVIFSFVITWFYSCIITSTGIYGHSSWGMRRFLGWSDISGVKKVSLGNLAFLKLRSNSGGTAIWLPLFQSDRVEFLETIRKCAPPGHPLLSHLG